MGARYEIDASRHRFDARRALTRERSKHALRTPWPALWKIKRDVIPDWGSVTCSGDGKFDKKSTREWMFFAKKQPQLSELVPPVTRMSVPLCSTAPHSRTGTGRRKA